jgi:hypothetical protein
MRQADILMASSYDNGLQLTGDILSLSRLGWWGAKWAVVAVFTGTAVAMVAPAIFYGAKWAMILAK